MMTPKAWGMVLRAHREFYQRELTVRKQLRASENDEGANYESGAIRILEQVIEDLKRLEETVHDG